MYRLIRSRQAKRDIVEVLRFTRRRWGDGQAREYAALIGEALVAIATNPEVGKARQDIRPGVFAYRLRQLGRPARHIVFYRLGDSGVVEVVRVLHEAMNFEQQLP
jgi:toxin ParE1/3/4